MAEAPLDPLLAVGIVAVAWISLSSRSLFTAVVLFIVFGLLMSLAWVRLDAPDIALAEAAIGAGITGALLLDAVAHVGLRDGGGEARPVARRVRLFAAAAAVAAVLLLGHAAARLPREAGGLTERAMASLAESGASNPVTAVLLNYRSYDTWLEVAVLLLAVVGVLAVAGQGVRAAPGRRSPGEASRGGADPMLRGMVRILLPVLILAGGYLVWRGSHAPGGAFQGGAVLGSAGVLLLLAGYRPAGAGGKRWYRFALTAGLASFLLAGLGTVAAGGAFLELQPEHAGRVIVAVEIAVTLSIALTLTALFALAGRQVSQRTGRSEGPRG